MYEKELALFGIRVRATRRALNITQKDLAQRAGITVRCLYSVENPSVSKSISLNTALKIAEALNVKITDLLYEDSVDTTKKI